MKTRVPCFFPGVCVSELRLIDKIFMVENLTLVSFAVLALQIIVRERAFGSLQVQVQNSIVHEGVNDRIVGPPRFAWSRSVRFPLIEELRDEHLDAGILNGCSTGWRLFSHSLKPLLQQYPFLPFRFECAAGQYGADQWPWSRSLNPFPL